MTAPDPARATPAPAHFPYPDHRTVAEADRERLERCREWQRRFGLMA